MIYQAPNPVKGAFAGGRTFLCSLAKPCTVCGTPSVALCDWPVEREEWRTAEEITIGDEITMYGKRREIVEKLQINDAVMLRWRTDATLGRGFTIHATHPISVLVPGKATCDNPVCDLHRRNLDDERDHCREHWDAWEKVA